MLHRLRPKLARAALRTAGHLASLASLLARADDPRGHVASDLAAALGRL